MIAGPKTCKYYLLLKLSVKYESVPQMLRSHARYYHVVFLLVHLEFGPAWTE